MQSAVSRLQSMAVLLLYARPRVERLGRQS